MVAGCIATIERLLRRTLVRSVILFGIAQVYPLSVVPAKKTWGLATTPGKTFYEDPGADGQKVYNMPGRLTLIKYRIYPYGISSFTYSVAVQLLLLKAQYGRTGRNTLQL